MGFKFKRVDLTAGSTEFPVGSDYSLKRIRSEIILTRCADALISCGWSLDTSRNSVTTEYSNVPCITGSRTYPGLFFKNTNSGCKLFMAYFGGTLSDEDCILDFKRNTVSPAHTVDLYGYGSNAHVSGLIMSVIPADSSSEFGSTFDQNFLPDDATRIIGTCFYDSQKQYSPAYGSDPLGGYIYSWGLFIDDHAIAVSANKSTANPSSLFTPVYAVGRIIGTLAHTEDSLGASQYGLVTFRTGYTTDSSEGMSPLIQSSFQYSFGMNKMIYYPGSNIFSSDSIKSFTAACVSKHDGTWLNGNSVGDSQNVTFYTQDPVQLSGRIFNSTENGKSRWVPLAVVSIAEDLETYGVVPGDGFKGYLDTQLFRCANGVYGQKFDKGNFICTDNEYNLIIGWDSSNTDSIIG